MLFLFIYGHPPAFIYRVSVNFPGESTQSMRNQLACSPKERSLNMSDLSFWDFVLPQPTPSESNLDFMT